MISVDLDQDGDMDVVYAVYGSDKIQWERNDGNQNFSTLTIDDNINAPTIRSLQSILIKMETLIL